MAPMGFLMVVLVAVVVVLLVGHFTNRMNPRMGHALLPGHGSTRRSG